MRWVIQENLFNEKGYEDLIAALVRLEIPHDVVKVVPFSHELVPDVNPPNPVVVMGAYTMLKIAKERGWRPGGFGQDSAKFNFVMQRGMWGDRMFNAEARVCDFQHVPEQVVPFFVRPVADSKSFTGHVTDWPIFLDWRERVLSLGEDSQQLQPDTPVMVAPVKTILREYRTWVVDGEVVTASLYKVGTQVRSDPQVEDDVLEFARDCVRLWQPSRAFCLDVFLGEDGLKIGEVNNLSAAGFYAADVQKLVAAVDAMEP